MYKVADKDNAPYLGKKVWNGIGLALLTVVLSSCVHRTEAAQPPLTILCSGQSNMAYTLDRAEASGWVRPLNLGQRLAATKIRFGTVVRNPQVAPSVALPTSVTMVRATDETIGDASAVCLFTALEIGEREDRSVDFVVSAVGGSKLEAWLPDAAANDLGLIDETHRNYFSNAHKLTIEWQEQIEGILNALPKPASSGSYILVPGDWERQGFVDLDGVVWLEKQFQLSKAEASSSGSLSLGTVDDWDTTFVNGCRVGGSYSWDLIRRYRVPQTCLQAGLNTVRVRIVDTGGYGGLRGQSSDVFFSPGDNGSTIPLNGDWQLSVAGPLPEVPPQPGNERTTPALLFNGMIAPLANFKFNYVIWYQGEENAFSGDAPREYAAKLSTLVAAWQALFQAPDMKFYVIQLPEFDPGMRSGPYAFGNIRIGQFLAAETDPHVTLVPALGTGVIDDIHPPDKTRLAKRVAAAILEGDLTPNDCEVVDFRGDAATGAILVEQCDPALTACQPSNRTARTLQQLRESVDASYESAAVIGRENVPKHWLSCQTGALAAQRISAREP